MKTTVGIVIAGVLVNAVGTAEPKEVNIALETLLRFDKKDQTPALTVIDKVQDVLEKFKDTLLNRRNNPPPMTFTDVGSRRSNSRDMTFTDFVLQAAKILNEYDDNNLEDVFAVIHDESRRYINRESGLQDAFGSSDVRRHLFTQLGAFEDVPAKMLRRHLDKAINAVENKIKTGEKNDILDVGNFLYLGASEKFRAALKNLDRIRRTNDVHVELMLRDTMRSLVFDHYSNLNDNIKRELIEMARDYWRVYSRNNGKYTPVSGLKRTGVTRFSLKERNKHDHKNRPYPAKRQMSIVQPITVNRNTFNKAGHKNKGYTNKFRLPKDLKLTSADTELIKFNSKTMLLPALRTRSTPSPKLKSSVLAQETSSFENSGQGNPYFKFKKYKSNNTTLTLAHSYENTKVLREFKAKPKVKEGDSAESDFMVVMGGQNKGDIGNIGRKGWTSSEESSKQSKNKEDEKRTSVETDTVVTDKKEIDTVETDTVETDTVGKNTVERVKRPFISVEKFTTVHASSEEVGVTKGNRFNVLSAGFKNKGVSGEGLAIESFENDLSDEKKVMRKSNSLDIFKYEDPETTDVKKVIQNIQNQIKNVEEEVSHVKNLSNCTDKPSEPKFKSVDSNETSFSKAKNRYRYPNSDSIEKENEAYFSRGIFENFSADKAASRFAFRASENGNDTNAPVIVEKQNYTKITVIENTTAKITATTHILNETAHVLNKPKTNITSESTLVTNHIKEDDNQHISDITKVESINKNNKRDNNNTSNEKQLHVEMVDMKLNEIDAKNKTVDKIIEENYVTLPQSKDKVNFDPNSQLYGSDIERIMAIESINKNNKRDNNNTRHVEMFDMKLNEIDAKNKTVDKMIEENYVTLPQSKDKVNFDPNSQLYGSDIERIMANSIDNIYQ